MPEPSSFSTGLVIVHQKVPLTAMVQVFSLAVKKVSETNHSKGH